MKVTFIFWTSEGGVSVCVWGCGGWSRKYELRVTYLVRLPQHGVECGVCGGRQESSWRTQQLLLLAPTPCSRSLTKKVPHNIFSEASAACVRCVRPGGGARKYLLGVTYW